MKLYTSATVSIPGAMVCRGRGLARVAVSVRYGLIDRGPDGLCLVDTGYASSVTRGPRSLPLRLYNAILRPQLIESQLPAAILAARGATLADVTTVILTHFHADHVAGLVDVPQARIVTFADAAQSVMAMSNAAAIHNGIFKELIPSDLQARIAPLENAPLRETGTALGNGYDVFGDGTYLAVPLPGHAAGHFGLLWREAGRPVLYATDAAWSHAAMMSNTTPALSRAVVFHDTSAGRRTEATLRSFMAAGGIVHLCHDVDLP
jgi:glyoxylase-like metal-dependent hydrolase (beta-lactamase superfamily II)